MALWLGTPATDVPNLLASPAAVIGASFCTVARHSDAIGTALVKTFARPNRLQASARARSEPEPPAAARQLQAPTSGKLQRSTGIPGRPKHRTTEHRPHRNRTGLPARTIKNPSTDEGSNASASPDMTSTLVSYVLSFCRLPEPQQEAALRMITLQIQQKLRVLDQLSNAW